MAPTVTVLNLCGEPLLTIEADSETRVSSIMRSVRGVLGGSKACALLQEETTLPPTALVAQVGRDADEIVLTAVVTIVSLRGEGRTAQELRDDEYTAQELRAAGYTVRELRDASYTTR